jgi:hypothetical protein
LPYYNLPFGFYPPGLHHRPFDVRLRQNLSIHFNMLKNFGLWFFPMPDHLDIETTRLMFLTNFTTGGILKHFSLIGTIPKKNCIDSFCFFGQPKAVDVLILTKSRSVWRYEQKDPNRNSR